jgi:predicted nucleic acid-binding protein
VVDKRYRAGTVVFDASPLIYLAKLDAFDVLETLKIVGAVTPTVSQETTRPAVAYRHRDGLVIEATLEHGTLIPLQLTASESNEGRDLEKRIAGLHGGECEVLAVAIERSMPAVIFERRARAVARALGIELVDITELLIDGTADADLLDQRIRRFGELVDMRLKDMERLLEVARKGRLP